jgi:hypothetical protein
MLIYYAISNEGISSCAGVAKANSAFASVFVRKQKKYGLLKVSAKKKNRLHGRAQQTQRFCVSI